MAGGRAEPIRQSDVAASSPWAAHLDVAKLQHSPLGGFLVKSAGFDRVVDLQEALKKELALDLGAVESVTLHGVGERGIEAVLLVRGRFQELDLASFPQAAQPGESAVAIHEGPQWNGQQTYLALRSDTELVGGTSIRAVRDGLALLAGQKKSWAERNLPAKQAGVISTATAQLALDMEHIGAELGFEAEFTKSLRRAWLLVGSREEDVEVTLLLDSVDAESLALVRSQLTLLTAALTSGPDTPPEWRALAAAIRVETDGNWISDRVSAPPQDTTRLLQSLGPLFNGEANRPVSSESPDLPR